MDTGERVASAGSVVSVGGSAPQYLFSASRDQPTAGHARAHTGTLASLLAGSVALTSLPRYPQSKCLPQPCALSPALLPWAELGLPSQLSGAGVMFRVPLAWLSLGDS